MWDKLKEKIRYFLLCCIEPKGKVDLDIELKNAMKMPDSHLKFITLAQIHKQYANGMAVMARYSPKEDFNHYSRMIQEFEKNVDFFTNKAREYVTV